MDMSVIVKPLSVIVFEIALILAPGVGVGVTIETDGVTRGNIMFGVGVGVGVDVGLTGDVGVGVGVNMGIEGVTRGSIIIGVGVGVGVGVVLGGVVGVGVGVNIGIEGVTRGRIIIGVGVGVGLIIIDANSGSDNIPLLLTADGRSACERDIGEIER